MRIAITGATGKLGRLVIEHLKKTEAASSLVALVRDPAKAADLGVEARPFDYSQPDGLVPALAGIDTLLLISSSEVGQRRPQHRHVVAAARQAGVKHLLYTSILHADTSAISLAEEHRDTEAALQAAGIPFTLLRNGWYTENYTAAAKGALARGALRGSARDGRLSLATRADYAAAAAAAVLASPSSEGKTYELAGDEAPTLTDLAAEISRQSGQAIPYQNLPAADYAAALLRAGLPEGLAHNLASWDEAAATGALFDDGHQLSRLIGRPTTPLADVVAAALRPA